MNEESRRPNPPWGPGKGSFMKVSINYGLRVGMGLGGGQGAKIETE